MKKSHKFEITCDGDAIVQMGDVIDILECFGWRQHGNEPTPSLKDAVKGVWEFVPPKRIDKMLQENASSSYWAAIWTQTWGTTIQQIKEVR